jgi:Zn-dependent protease with chaperone function
MKRFDDLDIYQRLARNRLRLATAFSLFAITIMLLSGLGLYLIYSSLRPGFSFWVLLVLIWLLYLLYAILRYAFGGRWVFKSIETIPEWMTDRRLKGALAAACLASGMTRRIRLFVIPHDDINAFSLSLPDSSYALFITQGVAEKMRERERVAFVSHEIAHMQAGDTAIYTILLRLIGPGAISRMRIGWEVRRRRYAQGEIELPPIFAFIFLALASLSFGLDIENSALIVLILLAAFLFLALASFLPLFMHKLLQLVLDRKREYAADMQAVFCTRDPSAVYLAVKGAAEDVRDVLLLPPYLDALLFHPVVDYLSYRPFRTQPSMMDRMRRLIEAFPAIDT